MAAPHDKKALSERDICTKFITPAIASGRLGRADAGARERPPHQGPRHRPGQARRPAARRSSPTTSCTYKPNLPLAVIEAKDNNHTRRRRACSRRSATPRCSTCRSCSRRTATASCFHDRTGHGRHGRAAPRPRRSSRRPRSSGAATAPWKGARRRPPSRSSRRTTTPTAGGKAPALLPAQRHQPRRSRPSPRGRTASCS